YAEYEKGYCIIEMMGEWNDAINNDIMFLKRDIIEVLEGEGITRFILIGENVLNFHTSDDSYYEEWFQELEDGWIAFINFSQHVLAELRAGNLDYYNNFGSELDEMAWRKLAPYQLFQEVENIMSKRIG